VYEIKKFTQLKYKSKKWSSTELLVSCWHSIYNYYDSVC